MFFCHGKALLVGLEAPGKQQRGEFISEHLVIDPEPLLGRKLIDVADLGITQNLQAHRLKMVKIACQLQTRTGNVFDRQPDGSVICGGKGHFQMEFFHQF